MINMNIEHARKAQDLETRTVRANHGRSDLRWHGESAVPGLAGQAAEANKWARAARKVTVAPRMKSAVDAAVEQAEGVASLVATEDTRLQDAKDRVEVSAVRVRDARLRLFDAAGAVSAGTLDASEAVKNHLEHVAALAEVACLEAEHAGLLESLRMGCTDATSQFNRAVTKAEELGRTLIATNQQQGVCGSTLNDMVRLGSAIGSLPELGYAMIEIAKARAGHSFAQAHPAEDFDELARAFEDAAAATLGIAQ